MQHRRRSLVLAAGGALSLLSLAIAGPAGAAPASGEPYKLGVTFPLSGTQSAWGQILVPAMEIAADNLNAAGGINGRPLKLVVEDTRSTPEGGISAMREAVQIEHVPAILSIFTNVVSAQIPLAEAFKVPLVNTAETPGLCAKSQWTFCDSPSLTRALPLMVERWKSQKVKRLFAFFTNNPSISQPSGALVSAEAKKLGIQYDESLFNLSDTDFRGLIIRAKDFNPDAILIYGNGAPTEGVIMKQIRELGMTTQLYAECACVTVKSYRDAAGNGAQGLIYAGIKYDRDSAKKFIDAYHAKLGFDPDYVGIEVYDTVMMIADGIRKNGDNGDGIRRTLASLTDFPSIGGGTLSMGENRQTLPPMALYQVKDVTAPTFVEIQP